MLRTRDQAAEHGSRASGTCLDQKMQEAREIPHAHESPRPEPFEQWLHQASALQRCIPEGDKNIAA